MDYERAEIDSAQTKRKRFNTGMTGTDQNFSTLSIDDKLSHMLQKLNNLEQSNQEIAKFSQGLSTVQTKVNFIERRADSHELLLKALAYKSIDIEARSRRHNLLFHGLAENKNEKLTDLMRDFLWQEMGLDIEDLYIDRMHRLGSYFKAKQKQNTDNPRRPVIVAFLESKSTETVLNAAYMLKGSNYSVTRDYPKEIIAARQNLMPQFKAERQNRNNKVTIEYPAKLIVNGKIVADEFPDWYPVLNYNRCTLAKNSTSMNGQSNFAADNINVPSAQVLDNRERCNQQQRPVNRVEDAQMNQSRTFAQVVQSSTSQQQMYQPVTNMVSSSTGVVSNSSGIQSQPVITNVPRYAPNHAGNQQPRQSQTTPTTITTNTTSCNASSMNSVRNAGANGYVSHDQPTYLPL
ncbi:MAG: hypothetical protein AB2693_32115 [Candidatus Thiodiazotropha sp.]